MPRIDWTPQGLALTLAVVGVFLIVLSLAIRYRAAKRGNLLIHAIGIIGGLAMGAAGGLYFLPATPDCFANAAGWHTVGRGNLEIIAVEPGEVEPADFTDVVCKLRPRTPGTAVSSIRWVIDEDKMVKKGDLLIILDDSEWQEQLKEKTIAPARRKFLEEQIANCRILAPRDGMAIYYILPRNFGSLPWLAQGELVREGQKLLTIFDPAKMHVQTHISRSQIDYVEIGRAARVHVDRFPDRTFEGQVSHIAQSPTKFFPEPKGPCYEVLIKLADPVAGVRPGMAANVRLELVRRENVLLAPLLSLLSRGRTNICFVKSDSQIVIRRVGTGASDSQFVEILAGLEEGEQVLRAPTPTW